MRALDSSSSIILWGFAIVLAGLVLAGGVFYVLKILPKSSTNNRPTTADFSSHAPAPKIVLPTTPLESTPEPSVESDDTPSPDSTTEDAAPEAPPPQIMALRVITWPMSQLDKKHRRRTIKTLMLIEDAVEPGDACRLGPRLVDIINSDLQAAYEYVKEPSERALRMAAANSVKRINAHVKFKMVKAIVHVVNPAKDLNNRNSRKTCSVSTDAAQRYFQ